MDLYFLLPPHVYGRFQGHLWNRQSALLQEVKNVLSDTYPNTDMSGDGQAVLVRFETYNVEVVPAFELTPLGLKIALRTWAVWPRKAEPRSNFGLRASGMLMDGSAGSPPRLPTGRKRSRSQSNTSRWLSERCRPGQFEKL